MADGDALVELVAELSRVRAALAQEANALRALGSKVERIAVTAVHPATTGGYDLSLQQAAGRARMTETGFKLHLRRHGPKLGRKQLGRWQVSSTALDELLATGSIL